MVSVMARASARTEARRRSRSTTTITSHQPSRPRANARATIKNGASQGGGPTATRDPGHHAQAASSAADSASSASVVRVRGSPLVGLATSADGVVWTKSEQNPILTPTPDSEFDSVYTSAQSVIRDGDGYRMYYGARIDLVHKYFAIGLATKQAKQGPLTGR